MVDGYTSHYSRTLFSNSSNPSFSSTLLDSIYRSIDLGEEEMVIYRDAIKKKKKKNYNSVSSADDADANVRGVLFQSEEEMANFERACMIEKWMEKKAGEKIVVRRKSMAAVDFQMKKSRKDRENSSFSSSDSSCGGGGFFSSSEAESFHGGTLQRRKTIRTGGSGHEEEKTEKNHRERRGFADQLEQKPKPKPKHEGGFLKTKSRALKIYGDLKKVKQPISPGGKLATFLNSLFTAGNLKKNKTATNPDDSPTLKSANTSTCSSVSSFSRSCLSKTPSSRGKHSSIAKRSVKFFPVSVIIDEDCQPCGHKSLHQENKFHNEKQNSELVKSNNGFNSIRAAIDEELMVHIMAKNRRVEEAAMDLLRKAHFKNQDFDEDFDDAASYASSDLFELDNLSAIGMERYREELPVYETTYLDTNRATIDGFITK